MAEEKAKPAAAKAPEATAEPVATEEVYQFSLPDGQVHAWHGSVEGLKTAHPDAVVMGQLVMDDLSQGSWAPYDAKAAKAAPKAKAPAAKDDEDKKDEEAPHE